MTDSPPTATFPGSSRTNCAPPASDVAQNLPAAGSLVRARGFTWRLRRIDHHASCCRIDLAPADGAAPARWQGVLSPPDRVRPAGPSWKWQAWPLAGAARDLAVRAIDATLPGRAALQPALSLIPWQGAAAAAFRDGRASRVLLADDVGLGKTVQAGLALASLAALGEARRVLVLTPPGLREQWAAELSRLFAREAVVADPARLRRVRRELPPYVNPWATWPTAVASIDFVKQAEVLTAVCDVPWDIVILDEAHGAGAATDRLEAAHALARRAAYVLLLTATPHGGRDDAFAALCGIGRVDGDLSGLAGVRRSRADVGLADDRRLRIASVRLRPAERRLHRLLHRYASSMWHAAAGSPATHLAVTVLLKRAASSAHALRRSVAWRLRLLEAAGEAELQSALPFDDAGERDGDDETACAALAAPGLPDRGRELRLLRALERLASDAAHFESKIDRVRRLVARIREPVIVFTEYRDTLDRAREALERAAPVAVLHGGLTRAERRAALDAFTSGRARVLLATDVAGEGLNLQATCRFVISLELPWTPSRLEQRIGRVHRLGQRRRVHGLHVVGRDTAESRVLARLAARVRSMRHALGSRATEGALPDTALAAAALDLPAPASAAAKPPVALEWLGDDCIPGGEYGRAEDARRLFHAASGRAPSIGPRRRRRGRAAGGAPLVRLSRSLAIRLGLRRGVTLVFDVEARSRAGTVAGRVLVPVQVELAAGAFACAGAAALAAALVPVARPSALAGASSDLAVRTARHRRWATQAAARESGLLCALRTAAVQPPVQAGLFDTRAVQAAARLEAHWQRREDHHARRLRRLADEQIIEQAEASPALALVVR